MHLGQVPLGLGGCHERAATLRSGLGGIQQRERRRHIQVRLRGNRGQSIERKTFERWVGSTARDHEQFCIGSPRGGQIAVQLVGAAEQHKQLLENRTGRVAVDQRADRLQLAQRI
jgi:hypothetical protein